MTTVDGVTGPRPLPGQVDTPEPVDRAAPEPAADPAHADAAASVDGEPVDTLEQGPGPSAAPAEERAPIGPDGVPAASAELDAEAAAAVELLLYEGDTSLEARMNAVLTRGTALERGLEDLDAAGRRAAALARLGGGFIEPTYLDENARTELGEQITAADTRRGAIEDVTAAVYGDLISVEAAQGLLARAREAGAEGPELERLGAALEDATAAGTPAERAALLGRALAGTRLETEVEGDELPTAADLRGLARANPERAFELLTSRIAEDPDAATLAGELLAVVPAASLDTPQGRALRTALADRTDAFPSTLMSYAERWGDIEVARFGQAIQDDPSTAFRTLARSWDRFGSEGAELQNSLRGIARTRLQGADADTFRRGMFVFSEPPWAQDDVEALQDDPPTPGTVHAMARAAESLRPAQRRSYVDRAVATLSDNPQLAPTLVPFAEDFTNVHVNRITELHEQGVLEQRAAATVLASAMSREGPAAGAARTALNELELDERSLSALERYVDGFSSGVELTEAGDQAVDIALDAHFPRSHLQALRDFGFVGTDADLQLRAAQLRASGITLDALRTDLTTGRALETLPVGMRDELTGPESALAAAPGNAGYIGLVDDAANAAAALEVARANGDPADIAEAEQAHAEAVAALDARRTELAAVGERLPSRLSDAESDVEAARAALAAADEGVQTAIAALGEHAEGRGDDFWHWAWAAVTPGNYLEEEQGELTRSIEVAREARAAALEDLAAAEARAAELRVANQMIAFEEARDAGSGAAEVAFNMWLETQARAGGGALDLVDTPDGPRAEWNASTLPAGRPPEMPQHVWDYLINEGNGMDLGGWQRLHRDNPERFRTATPPELLTGVRPDGTEVEPGAPGNLEEAIDLALSGGSGELSVAFAAINDDPRVQRAAVTLGATAAHMNLITQLMENEESRSYYDDPVETLRDHAAEARALLTQPGVAEDVAAARAALERLRPGIEALDPDDPQRQEFNDLMTNLETVGSLMDPDHQTHRVLDRVLDDDFVGQDFWGVMGTDGVDFGIQIGTMVAGAAVGVAAVGLAAPSGGTSLGFLTIAAGAFGAATVGVAADELVGYSVEELTGLGTNRTALGRYMSGDLTVDDAWSDVGARARTNFVMQLGVGVAARMAAPLLERGAERFLAARYANDPARLRAAMDNLAGARTAASQGRLEAYLREVGEESVHELTEAAIVGAATQLAGDDAGLADLLAPVGVASVANLIANMGAVRARAINTTAAGITVDSGDIQAVREAYDNAGFDIVNVVDTGDGIAAFIGVAPTGQRVLVADSDTGLAELEANLAVGGQSLSEVERILQQGESGVAFLRGVQRSAAAEQLLSQARALEAQNVPFDQAVPRLQERWRQMAESWNQGAGGGQDRGVMLDPDNVPGFATTPTSYDGFRETVRADTTRLDIAAAGDGRLASAQVRDGERVTTLDGGLDADAAARAAREETIHHGTFIDPDSELSFAETGYRDGDPAYNLEGEAYADLVIMREADPGAFGALMNDRAALERHVRELAQRYEANSNPDIAGSFDGATDVASAVTDRLLARNAAGTLTLNEAAAPTVTDTEGTVVAADGAPQVFGPAAMKVFTHDGNVHSGNDVREHVQTAVSQINARARALHAAGRTDEAAALVEQFNGLRHTGRSGAEITPSELTQDNINAFVRPLGLTGVVAPEGGAIPEGLRFGRAGAGLLNERVGGSANGRPPPPLTAESFNEAMAFISEHHTETDRVVPRTVVEQALESVRDAERTRQRALAETRFNERVAAEVEAGRGAPFEVDPDPNGIDFSNASPEVRAAFQLIGRNRNGRTLNPGDAFFAPGSPSGTNLTNAELYQRWFDADTTTDVERIASFRAMRDQARPDDPIGLPGFPSVIAPGAEPDAASARLRELITAAESEIRRTPNASFGPMPGFADQRLVVPPDLPRPSSRERSGLDGLARVRQVFDEEGTRLFNTWARTATGAQINQVLGSTGSASAGHFPVATDRLVDRIRRADSRIDINQLRRDAEPVVTVDDQVASAVAAANDRDPDYGARVDAALAELRGAEGTTRDDLDTALRRINQLNEAELPAHLLPSDILRHLTDGIRTDESAASWLSGATRRATDVFQEGLVAEAREHGTSYARAVEQRLGREMSPEQLLEVAGRIDAINGARIPNENARATVLDRALGGAIPAHELPRVLELAHEANYLRSDTNADGERRLDLIFGASDVSSLKEALAMYTEASPVPRSHARVEQDPMSIVLRESQQAGGDVRRHTRTVLKGLALARAGHLDESALETFTGSELATAIQDAHVGAFTSIGLDQDAATAIAEAQFDLNDVMQTLGNPAAMANIERLAGAGRSDAVRSIMTDYQLLTREQVPAALQRAMAQQEAGQLGTPVDIDALRDEVRDALTATAGDQRALDALRDEVVAAAAGNRGYQDALRAQLRGLTPTALQESLARIEALNGAPGLNDNNRAAILERVLQGRHSAQDLERVFAATPALGAGVGQAGFDARVDALMNIADVDSFVTAMREYNRLNARQRIPAAGPDPSLDPLTRYIEATQVSPVARSEHSQDLTAPHRVLTGLELVRQGILSPDVFTHGSGAELQAAIRNGQIERFTAAGFDADRAGDIVDNFEFFSWSANGGAGLGHLYGDPETIQGLGRLQDAGYDSYVDAILNQVGADPALIPGHVDTAWAMLEQDGELPDGREFTPEFIRGMLTSEAERRVSEADERPGAPSALESGRAAAPGSELPTVDTALGPEARSSLGTYLTDWALQHYGQSRSDLEALNRIALDFEAVGRELDPDLEEQLLDSAVTLHRGGMSTSDIAALPDSVLNYMGQNYAAIRRLNFHRTPADIARAAENGTTPAGQPVWNDLMGLVTRDVSEEAAPAVLASIEQFVSPNVDRGQLREFRSSLAETADGRALLEQHRRSRFARSALPELQSALNANPNWTVEQAAEWYQNRWNTYLNGDGDRTGWNQRVDRAVANLAAASPTRAEAIRQQFGSDPSLLRIDDGPAPGLGEPPPASIDALVDAVRARSGGIYTGSRDPYGATVLGTAGGTARAPGTGHVELRPAAFDQGHATVARVLAHESDHILRGFNYRPAHTVDDVTHNAMGETLAFLRGDTFDAPSGLDRLIDPNSRGELEAYVDEIVRRYEQSGAAGPRYFGIEDVMGPRALTDEERSTVVQDVTDRLLAASSSGRGTPAENFLETLRRPDATRLLGIESGRITEGPNQIPSLVGGADSATVNHASVRQFHGLLLSGDLTTERALALMREAVGVSEGPLSAAELNRLFSTLQSRGVTSQQLAPVIEGLRNHFAGTREPYRALGAIRAALRAERPIDSNATRPIPPSQRFGSSPAATPTGNNFRFTPSRDVDLRRTGATFQDALTEAFLRTGIPRDLFVVSQWGISPEGKSIPVEYRGPNGATVNLDIPEWNNTGRDGSFGDGPVLPHIGYQTPGRGQNRIRGHVFIDQVPSSR